MRNEDGQIYRTRYGGKKRDGSKIKNPLRTTVLSNSKFQNEIFVLSSTQNEIARREMRQTNFMSIKQQSIIRVLDRNKHKRININQ